MSFHVLLPARDESSPSSEDDGHADDGDGRRDDDAACSGRSPSHSEEITENVDHFSTRERLREGNSPRQQQTKKMCCFGDAAAITGCINPDPGPLLLLLNSFTHFPSGAAFPFSTSTPSAAHTQARRVARTTCRMHRIRSTGSQSQTNIQIHQLGME